MIPSEMVSGDTIAFSVDAFRDAQGRTLSPPAWNASISFRGNGNTLDVVSDSAWKFTISPAQSSLLKTGIAYFQLYATNPATSERVMIEQGRVKVIANFATADQNFDARSQTRKDLDAVQSLIRQLVQTGGVVEYRIGDRQAKKYDLAELRAEESKLLFRLAREERADRIAQGLGDPLSKYVRFT